MPFVTLEPQWPLFIIGGHAILIDSPQGVHPFPASNLNVVITPALARAVPTVHWQTTSGIVVRSDPGGTAFGAIVPPYASLDRNGWAGPFTISATVDAPIDRRVAISGYAYESIALGCDQFYGGGYRIDATGVPHETKTIDTSDIYWQAPIDPNFAVWNRCSSDFKPTSPASAILATPGGAVVVADEHRFATVDGSRWRGPTRYRFDAKSLRGTLLWRTRDGRLMKTLQLFPNSVDVIGPTIMADANGRFADNP